ncbi:F8K7.16 [Salix purpurea]|uniref:F8K7.16 n=1 Tax=Salix purpurea TaxID=77065 RepID=A0A9Q0PCR0_SALPP|nr:F8K7.16 [Salix purpurea]
MGICECSDHSPRKLARACLVMSECSCIFKSDKLIMLTRIIRHGHRSDLSELDTSEEDYNYAPGTVEICVSLSRRTGDYRRVQYLRKSFRPRTRRIRVGLGSDFDYGFKRIPLAKHGEQIITLHNVRMTHTSQSVLKGSSLSR